MFLKEKGFTLIEFAVIVALLAILVVSVCTGCIGAGDKAREEEVKSNIWTIKAALDRYGADHNGSYPEYIFGGDRRGWNSQNGCRAITEAEEGHRPPTDPLIEKGYLSSYPENPFLGYGRGVREIIAKTGTVGEKGYGDVRFGWDGDFMGNCLDDPRFLFDGPGQPTHLQYTMLPDAEAGIGVLREGGPNSFYCMGGLPGEGDETIRAWWPGQFFYRACGDFFIPDSPGDLRGQQFENIWGWPYARINKFLLVGFGSIRNPGLDIIRLTTKSGLAASEHPDAIFGSIEGEYYQDHSDPDRPASHPDFDVQVAFSSPEVCGGGDRGLMPQFPYLQESTTAWLFGAPDGFRDGVIITVTNTGFSIEEHEGKPRDVSR